VVVTLLIGCAILLLAVGCSGTRSEAPKEKQQGHTEATNKEQTRSSEATSEEEARCGETRTFDVLKKHNIAMVVDGRQLRPGDPEVLYTTNDLSGCPTGGLLFGTDELDRLAGENGDDEVHGLGAADKLLGGYGSDVIYGGRGDDKLYGGGLVGLEDYRDWSNDVIHGGPGKDYLDGDGGADVLRGGDGNDLLNATEDRGRPDELYCGEGRDRYIADKGDHVDSSCETKWGTM
jgi:hypothetical protein